MSSRWQYGSYTFKINPKSSETSINVIGDEVRTLSGALISQPTTTTESYDVATIFYQPRTRVQSEVSIPNCTSIEYYNGSYYVLNVTNDRIDIYNSNFIFQSSISLSALSVKTYVEIDVVSTGIWVASNGASVNDTIYQINFSGVIQNTKTITKTANPISGIQEINGLLYILNGSSIDIYAIPSVVKVDTIALQGTGYSGLSSDSKYLIVGNQDIYGNNMFYHIDQNTGRNINGITTDAMLLVSDVTFDGTYFYSYIASKSSLQKIVGNTVMLDIYNLEKEIKSNNFVNMIDDMGTTRRVRASSFRKTRRLEYEVAYDVSLSIDKVNRG